MTNRMMMMIVVESIVISSLYLLRLPEPPGPDVISRGYLPQ
jgi:hypothetical protein